MKKFKVLFYRGHFYIQATCMEDSDEPESVALEPGKDLYIITSSLAEAQYILVVYFTQKRKGELKGAAQ